MASAPSAPETESTPTVYDSMERLCSSADADDWSSTATTLFIGSGHCHPRRIVEAWPIMTRSLWIGSLP
jgi:hypothetical protein